VTSERRNHEAREMGLEDCVESRVERFELPKSIEIGNLSLIKPIIRWMSTQAIQAAALGTAVPLDGFSRSATTAIQRLARHAALSTAWTQMIVIPPEKMYMSERGKVPKDV
jgi:hypothetical protein